MKWDYQTVLIIIDNIFNGRVTVINHRDDAEAHTFRQHQREALEVGSQHQDRRTLVIFHRILETFKGHMPQAQNASLIFQIFSGRPVTYNGQPPVREARLQQSPGVNNAIDPFLNIVNTPYIDYFFLLET